MRRLIPLLIVALAGGGWLLGWSPYLRVEAVAVSGIASRSPLTTERILSVAGVSKGMPMARVNEASVRRALLGIARVGSVDVRRRWPKSIEIRITERVPWALVRTPEGMHFVDDDGFFFARVGGTAEEIPMVILPRRSPELVRDLVGVLRSMPAELANSITQMSAPTSTQLTLEFARDDRTLKVLWGDSSESVLKARVLQELLGRNESGRWTSIDLSAPRAPTTRE